MVLGALAACTSVTVKTDYDHSASFGKYHTYMLDTAASGLGPTNNVVLQQALRSNLAARGLKETGSANASLYVVAAVITQQKVNVLPGSGVTVTRFGAYHTWALQCRRATIHRGHADNRLRRRQDEEPCFPRPGPGSRWQSGSKRKRHPGSCHQNRRSISGAARHLTKLKLYRKLPDEARKRM